MISWEWSIILVGLFVYIVYWLGAALIDHNYRRKAEFVEDIQGKIKDSTNATS